MLYVLTRCAEAMLVPQEVNNILKVSPTLFRPEKTRGFIADKRN
jgi:hypothetical protein